jgi:hypothetical protein
MERFLPKPLVCPAAAIAVPKQAANEKDADLTRRGFLCSAIAGTAVALGAAAVTSTRPALAQSTLTPEAALKELMDGNERYIGGQLFVTRLAGNVVTPEITASLEYGVAVPGHPGPHGTGAQQLRRGQGDHRRQRRLLARSMPSTPLSGRR